MNQIEMFKNAKWVDCDGNNNPIIRGKFHIDGFKEASINICGLGYFELYINGKRVGNDYFIPAASDYEERKNLVATFPINDAFSYRIYVLKYDISSYIKNGDNTIGVFLGNGFYNQTRRKNEGNMEYGNVKLCFNITWNDENNSYDYGSSSELQWKESFIIENNLYFGESHDYTKATYGWMTYSDSSNDWASVREIDAPNSNFLIQDCPTDKICKSLEPKVLKVFDDYTVYDLGENNVGFPLIHSDSKGELVEVCYAEEINEDLTINPESAGKRQYSKDTYFTDGITKEFCPKFVWHGYRYFTVTNNAYPVISYVIHSDIKQKAFFECDNEVVNWFHETYIRSQLANMHGSIPSDCPHRERLGYTGDGQLCINTVMTLFDSESFYAKWMEDIVDGQDPVSGHVQHTAPFQGGGGGPVGWGGAVIVVPYQLYRHTGKIEYLKKYFHNIKLYVNYIKSRSDDGIVMREEPKGWCLGDWCTPEKEAIPEPYVNTCLFVKFLGYVKEISIILGDIEYSKEIDKDISYIKNAIVEKYYDKETNRFMENIQGANAYALDIGLGNEEMYKNLVEQYTKSNAFDTGIIGTEILIRYLFERGNAELAMSLISSTVENHSFGYEMLKGATTLWEYWDGKYSHNHPMFGSIIAQLYYGLLGIKPINAGYDEVVIAPQIVSFINDYSGSIGFGDKIITVKYTKVGEKRIFKVIIGKGVKAKFRYDGKEYNLLPLEVNNFIV